MLSKIGIKKRIDLYVLIFNLILVLLVYVAKIAPHQFNINWTKNKGAKSEFFIKNKDKNFTKSQGKGAFFKYLGKTDSQILTDKVATVYLYSSIIIPTFLPSLLNSSTLGGFYTISFGLMYLSVQSLKNNVKKERPDKGNMRSFPSGHSAGSAVLPGFLHKFYNLKIASPFYILAMTVGASRIYCDRHDIIDVIAGLIIGILSGYYGNSIAKFIMNYMSRKSHRIQRIKDYFLMDLK